MGASAPRNPLLRAAPLAAITAFAVYCAHLGFGLGGAGSDWFFNDFVYNGLELLAAGACFARALLVKGERAPWLVVGAGLFCYFAGDVFWTLFLSDSASPPFPSPADALYLAFYPASYVTIVLLVRARVKAFRPSVWLDGGLTALAVAALASAFVFQPIIDATEGNTAAVVTNLA